MVTAQPEQMFVIAQVRGRDHRRAGFCFTGEAWSSENKLECRALLICTPPRVHFCPVQDREVDQHQFVRPTGFHHGLLLRGHACVA